MAANPRLASVRAAARTTRNLENLFNRLGNSRHPRGRILIAYRNAIRALRDIARRYPKGGAIAVWETREVFDGLEREIRRTATNSTASAVELGRLQGEAEVAAWGLQSSTELVDTTATIDAWTGVVQSQAQQAAAVVGSGGDWAYVLGDETRLGIARATPTIDTGTKYLTIASMLALAATVGKPIASTGIAWGKQTVPAIDERTTDCCLRAAGQVVPFDGKFRLTGTPRFADEMDWTPFHWYCRTSIVTVPLTMADDDVTGKLKAASSKERVARERATDRIKEVVEELIRLEAIPDAQVRVTDTEAITALRKELKGLRQRGGYPGS